MQIHIHRDGQQYGPYSVEEAREHLETGALLPDDIAWHAGITEWLPLSQVLEAAGPAHDGVAGHDPVFAPEPQPEDQPEPVRTLTRSVEPSWVPPRRDGMQSPATFAQPARLAVAARVPAASPSAPALASAPVRVTAAAPKPVISEAQAQAYAKRQVAGRFASRTSRPGALRAVIVNGIICLVGVAITIGTYEEAASSPRGGTYTIAWGAILFGGIRCVVALVHLLGD